MPVVVKIRGGKTILDSKADLPPQRKWHLDKDGYVVDSRNRRLHREIVGAPPGFVVDHIDGNPLNNQRSNLRVCTQQQNLWNGKPHRDGTSRYRGVSWDKRGGRWCVQIQGKTIGFFVDENAAADAYNHAAINRFGSFARPNVVRRAGLEPARENPARF